MPAALRFSVLPARRFLALTTLGLSLIACGKGPTHEVKGPSTASAEADLPPLEGESGPTLARQSPRRVGDIFVHRFSGSKMKSELLLREEVISQNDDTMTVDFILSEGDTETHLRALLALPSERVLRVAMVDADGEVIPAAIADFEKMLEKTTFVPDRNAGQMASSSETCLIGKDELDCDLAEYKVYLGEREAKLKVARSPDMQRDISGEIVGVDGTILYHAELVEMKRGEELPEAAKEGVALRSAELGNSKLDSRD